MKTIIKLSAIFLSIILVSCMDEFNVPETSTGAKDMQNLRVSTDFNWSTASTISVKIIGLPLPVDVTAVKSSLTIKGAENTYYSGLHAINENLTLTLNVSNTEKTIHLKFGTIEQTAEIIDNKVEFSFIPVVID